MTRAESTNGAMGGVMMPQTLNGNPYLGASSTATATDPNFSGNTNNVTNYSGTTSIPQGGIPSYSQVK